MSERLPHIEGHIRFLRDLAADGLKRHEAERGVYYGNSLPDRDMTAPMPEDRPQPGTCLTCGRMADEVIDGICYSCAQAAEFGDDSDAVEPGDFGGRLDMSVEGESLTALSGDERLLLAMLCRDGDDGVQMLPGKAMLHLQRQGLVMQLGLRWYATPEGFEVNERTA